MGYELDKLMKIYGVSTPGRVAYSGATLPASAPVATASQADKDAYEAIGRQREADMPVYQDYRSSYAGRVASVPMYNETQYGGAPGAGRPDTGAPGGFYDNRLAAPIYTPVGPKPTNTPTSGGGTPGGGTPGGGAPDGTYGGGAPGAGGTYGGPTTTDQYGTTRNPDGTVVSANVDVSKYWDPTTGKYLGNWPGIDKYLREQEAARTSIGGSVGADTTNYSQDSSQPGYFDSNYFDQYAGFDMRAFHKGGSVHDLTRKYNVGGAVKRFQVGGLQEDETTPISPAATDLMGLMNTYLTKSSPYAAELKAATAQNKTESDAFATVLQNAMKSRAAPPDKTELYFRLAAAFGSPTKTGGLTENLALAGKEMGEYSKEQRAVKKAEDQLQLELGLETQKLKMQGARDEVTSLRSLASEENKDRRAILMDYLKSGQPQSEGGKIAVDIGLKPGTPAHSKFVTDYVAKKLEGDDAYKTMMAGIAQGNLTIREDAAERQRAAATKLTPNEVKLKTETENNIGSLDDSMGMLQSAYNLNPFTFDGTLRDWTEQKVLEQIDPKDKSVLATRQQANLLSKGAIAKLKASLGGNPTEGERSAILALEGIDAMSKEERKLIMEDTYAILKARRGREQKRLNEITQGLYRDTVQTPIEGLE